jgi:hypothetical protein
MDKTDYDRKKFVKDAYGNLTPIKKVKHENKSRPDDQRWDHRR